MNKTNELGPTTDNVEVSRDSFDDVPDILESLDIDSSDAALVRATRYSQRNSQLNIKQLCVDYLLLRQQGMEEDQAAQLCGITPQRWKSLKQGVGLDEEQHVQILLTVSRAEAEFEKLFLARISKASKTDWRAATWMLERCSGNVRYQQRTKQTIDVNTIDATSAVRELEKLRGIQEEQ